MCIYVYIGDADTYIAARQTLSAKRDAGTGHTSWSAAWEASLWARLGLGDDAYSALKRITNRFVTQRMLSLHPATVPNKESRYGHCLTCVAGVKGHDKGVMQPNAKRELTTFEKSVV